MPISRLLPASFEQPNPTNLVINGDMSCWQRSASASATGYTSVDRWSYYAPSSLAVSRSTDVPTGFQYATSVGGGGDSSGLTQKIEASSCKQLVGATITVSFYLKQTTGSGTDKIAVALARANSEDNFGGTTSISSQTISSTSSYARYTCTFTSLPTEVANGLQLTIKSNGGGAVVYLITGVCLNVGSHAIDFPHEPYAENLQKCLRYYQKHLGWITHFNRGLDANYDAHVVQNGVGIVGFMRATPTETIANVYRWDAGDSNWTSDSTAFSAAISSNSQTFVEGYYGRQNCNAVKADWELIAEL